MTEAENIENKRSPAQFLRAIYLERKAKNPSYSLNAFARDLDLSASQVSRLLSGSRAFTLRQIFHLTSILNLNETETQNLIVEVIKRSNQNAKIPKHIRDQFLRADGVDPTALEDGKTDNFYSSTNLMYLQYEVERFKSISQWYHLAILNLTYTQGFNSDPRMIAERLGITTAEATEAVDRLLHLGLLRRDENGVLKKTSENLYIKTIRSESAIRKFQEEMLEKAKDELKKTSDQDHHQRIINSITFACSPSHIEELKSLVDDFYTKALSLTKPGPHTDVFQLNCQLFSLTQTASSAEGAAS